ncbi:MAG: hypothetical protein ACLQDY_13525 [Streptosporangiaceae bacterium]
MGWLAGKRRSGRSAMIHWIHIVAAAAVSCALALSGCVIGAPAPVSSLSALRRVPWDGGPRYWARWPATAASGWTNPAFFPIVSWFDGISSNSEVRYDKAHGFNTYMGVDTATPYQLFVHNHVYLIGDRLNDMPAHGVKNWVGYFLADEADGYSPPSAGLAYLRSLRKKLPSNRFVWANFSSSVVSRYMKPSDAKAFVNDFTNVVSLDMYWYTIPFCSNKPYLPEFIVPIRRATCRTASSYGAMVDALRQLVAAGRKSQAVWAFAEILNGGPGGGPFVANIRPAELRGAVMNSIINEARGIVYFNQSLNGPCQGSNIIRQSQYQPGFCGAAQVAAAGVVNNQIHALARVLNTQSYVWRFGSGLDTMLKVYHGSAYIFAMVNGSSSPGKRQFTLPPGVNGKRVQVLFEHRWLPVRNDRFQDNFAAEYSYHIYRVPLSAAAGGG